MKIDLVFADLNLNIIFQEKRTRKCTFIDRPNAFKKKGALNISMLNAVCHWPTLVPQWNNTLVPQSSSTEPAPRFQVPVSAAPSSSAWLWLQSPKLLLRLCL